MTPEQLKSSIFQMAFQGKLVEQKEDKKVSIAEVDEIRKKQARLAKDKIIKIGKYDKDNYEYDYEYPESWTLVKIGDISNLVTKQTGFDYSKTIKPSLLDHYEENTLPLIQTRNFKGKEFNMVSAFYIPIAVANEYEQLKLKEKCLLVSIVGSIGNVGLFDEDTVGFLGGAITKIDLTDKDLTDYIFYFLQSPIGQFQLNKNKKKTAQATITVEDVRNIIIPVPPLEERHRIVAKIEELLPYVDRYAEAYEKLEQFNTKFPEDMKKSILQYAIQGKLVEQRPEEGTAEELYKWIQDEKQKLIKVGRIKKEKPLAEITEDEIPFDIPESWMWVRFDDLAGFYNGDRGKNYPNKSEYVSDGVAWINTGHISPTGFLDEETMNYITEEKYNSLSGGKIMDGDMVYCLRGATFGKVARIEPFSVGAIASSLMGIRPVKKELREYIYLYLKSPLAKQQLTLYENGSAQQNLAAKDVRKYLIPLPPLEEQIRIIAKVNELLPWCERLVQ